MAKTTGFHDAGLVPVGSVLAHAYWTTPTGYTTGTDEYASRGDALLAAIRAKEAQVAEHARGMNRSVPLPERITIDLRWHLKYPNGGGLETVAERCEYESIAEAKAALQRLIDYRMPGEPAPVLTGTPIQKRTPR